MLFAIFIDIPTLYHLYHTHTHSQQLSRMQKSNRPLRGDRYGALRRCRERCRRRECVRLYWLLYPASPCVQCLRCIYIFIIAPPPPSTTPSPHLLCIYHHHHHYHHQCCPLTDCNLDACECHTATCAQLPIDCRNCTCFLLSSGVGEGRGSFLTSSVAVTLGVMLSHFLLSHIPFPAGVAPSSIPPHLPVCGLLPTTLLCRRFVS